MKSGQAFREIIEKLGKEQSVYLSDFFRDCPGEVVQAMQYVKIPRGQTILQAGRGCEYVWVVIKGEVSGEDIQMTGNVYSFLSSRESASSGIMNCLQGFLRFRRRWVRLRTVRHCGFRQQSI